MPNRDVVIKGLEPILACATVNKWGAWIDTLEDAIELLKEQEAVEPNPDKEGIYLVSADDGNYTVNSEPPKPTTFEDLGYVEVVRCKDCKWYAERISWCDNCRLPREQTFFCADGKRR